MFKREGFRVMKISKKTEDRILSNLPKFQKVLGIAKARDLNESDTVSIITDILAGSARDLSVNS